MHVCMYVWRYVIVRITSKNLKWKTTAPKPRDSSQRTKSLQFLISFLGGGEKKRFWFWCQLCHLPLHNFCYLLKKLQGQYVLYVLFVYKEQCYWSSSLNEMTGIALHVHVTYEPRVISFATLLGTTYGMV